ncbi:iron-containing alcohol dehydrogenase [Photobacterium sp. WH77]|uniref:iron-containing alcohol dehydrogenase n=1 Tax=unclassified Photobacterium TaxID=2628852 RepID=UPI001EDB998E|nr:MULTISPECIES: iron-containing alcohol dehydrogenase [unclassified Photobacterium]MCG2837866.1 iron-containing alcohol dehydrogenase [Photobacterium sp. WH77]MCG2845484.1 iron-containing alcohol dehydrogenase [Photobacterium sp. WH80]
MSLKGNWNYPTPITVGEGCLQQIAQACRDAGISNALLVTDPGLAALSMVTETVALCREAGIGCEVFSRIQGNPTGENVEDGLAVYRQGGFDGVIAFGGGSSLDAAKAIALMAGQSLPLWAFEDVGDNWLQANADAIAPVIAIPTTAGTGSEVGRASVITDTANHVKKIIFHPKMLPVCVLLDPAVTTGLPPHITAATGMDALSHNLEAYCANGYHPMAEGIALEGIRLIKAYLPQAVADGSNLEARTQMLVASSMGATAFQRGLGGMHAIAHTLGALYDKHHGLLNAILMPYVLVANRSAIEDKLTHLARYLDLPEPGFDAFLTWILDFRAALQIPHTLADIDITVEEAQRVGRMAVQDPSAGGNPVALSAEQYSRIFVDAVTGRLPQH